MIIVSAKKLNTPETTPKISDPIYPNTRPTP